MPISPNNLDPGDILFKLDRNGTMSQGIACGQRVHHQGPIRRLTCSDKKSTEGSPSVKYQFIGCISARRLKLIMKSHSSKKMVTHETAD